MLITTPSSTTFPTLTLTSGRDGMPTNIALSFAHGNMAPGHHVFVAYQL
ncbi:MAG: hypothetical protein ABFC94_13730 [Syntrophomonas sp.]